MPSITGGRGIEGTSLCMDEKAFLSNTLKCRYMTLALQSQEESLPVSPFLHLIVPFLMRLMDLPRLLIP